MDKIKEKFFHTKMTWAKVILFALVTAVITGVLKIIPALDNTSFQDIAINYEWWILFAVFIVVNCSKWWEASLKTFVFFLISQPLIYLIQVPFNNLGFGIFKYYKYWFIITLLTLPGAVIAYQIKKHNWLSVPILGVATGLIAYTAPGYLWNTVYDFPSHVISLIFCFLIALFLIFMIFDEKPKRLVSVGIFLIVFIVASILLKPVRGEVYELPQGNWTFTNDDSSVTEVVLEGNQFTVKALKDGYSHYVFTSDSGEVIEYYASVTGGGLFLSKLE